MGPPKHKWTAEEEEALRSGIKRYGIGYWSKILNDPEFSIVLYLRSNVDLKDKWRNMHEGPIGASRNRTRAENKKLQQPMFEDDEAVVPSSLAETDVEIHSAKAVEITNGAFPDGGSKKPFSSWEDLILEIISNMKEPRGSKRAEILDVIKEKYLAPPNLRMELSRNLKLLMENGKLIKEKRRYQVAGSSSHDLKEDDSSLLLNGKKNEKTRKKHRPSSQIRGPKVPKKTDTDKELLKMMTMTPAEAEAFASQLVKEAEAAITKAEKAVYEAEKAEGEADAAEERVEQLKQALRRKESTWTWNRQ